MFSVLMRTIAEGLVFRSAAATPSIRARLELNDVRRCLGNYCVTHRACPVDVNQTVVLTVHDTLARCF